MTAAETAKTQAQPPRFTQLYRRHSRELLAFFTARVYDPEVAMDLTAETFAQALLGRRRLRGHRPEQARAWLYGIARRQLALFIRRGAAETRALSKLGIERSQLSEEAYDRVLELADADQLGAALRAGLQSLSEPQRQIVRMRVLEERSYGEIADALEVSIEAARTRLHRALAKLAGFVAPSIDQGGSA